MTEAVHDGADGNLVVAERHGDVLELRLANPPYNGLTGPLLRCYLERLEAARTDDGVKAVVTTSAADTWTVGGDLGDIAAEPVERSLSELLHDALGETGELGLADRKADRLGAGRHVLAIDAFDKPLIAAIGGAAAGGGLALALLHDVRFASQQAVFVTAFSRIGLALEMGLSFLLPRAIGPQAAFDLVATGRRVDAAEAERLGLVFKIVDHAELRDAALSYAAELAERPPLGLQLAKRMLRRTWDNRLADQLELEWPWQVAAFASPEARAAIEAFARRRR
jgi:enoyl-CoA hydratase/carnithine racemase